MTMRMLVPFLAGGLAMLVIFIRLILKLHSEDLEWSVLTPKTIYSDWTFKLLDKLGLVIGIVLYRDRLYTDAPLRKSYSVLRVTPEGHLVAYVYSAHKIGGVILLPNHRTAASNDGYYHASYIVGWDLIGREYNSPASEQAYWPPTIQCDIPHESRIVRRKEFRETIYPQLVAMQL